MTNVLIVDDETHIVEMLEVRLKAQGVRVETAASAVEAVDIISKHAISVALVDIMMPGMNGIELLREIKEKAPDTEVIIITGYASLGSAIDAVKLGAYDYIKKPFEDIQGLMRTVTGAIGKRVLSLENKRLTEELKEANEKLKDINLMLGENVNELVMLHHVVESISGLLSLDEVINKFMKNLVESLGFRRAALYIADEKKTVLELKRCEGISGSDIKPAVIAMADEMNGIVRAINTNEPVFISDISAGPGSVADSISGDDTKCVVLYPLAVMKKPVGALVLESDEAVQMKKAHSMSLYINQAALIIENARMFKAIVEINEELAAMNQLKSEFISTVSHELRTPLTTVKEGVSIMLDRVVGEINEKQARILEISKQDVDRLSRLIEDLLDISKIESGKISLDRVWAPPRELIDASINSVKGVSSEKKIRINVSCGPDLPEVFIDRDRVIQV
ncbi:MAG: response regulator, partial [Candidatus Omnitrophota bacterium]